MKLIFNAPINNLSFGNVTYNILREMYKQDDKPVIFPIGEPDYSAFDKIDEDFKSWIENSIEYRYHNLDRDLPTLTLWHLNGAERSIGSKNHLLTFYELNQPTYTEKKIVDMQYSTMFTASSSIQAFNKQGCKNLYKINLGLDPDFKPIDKPLIKNKIHFVLMGKFEKRKHTKEVIQLWLKKYGNDNKYLLSCCITNPFLKEKDMTTLLSSIVDGKHYSNINFLPHLKTNSEVNHLLNSAHIDLTGVSGAEGWNLPAFNATALGKWSIVYNHTGHSSWATKENSILLEPKGTEEAYDGLFFNRNSKWNQGEIYTFDEEQVSTAMDMAVDLHKETNEGGLKMAKQFTYENTLNSIKKVIENG
jgi:hypothetical protein